MHTPDIAPALLAGFSHQPLQEHLDEAWTLDIVAGETFIGVIRRRNLSIPEWFYMYKEYHGFTWKRDTDNLEEVELFLARIRLYLDMGLQVTRELLEQEYAE